MLIGLELIELEAELKVNAELANVLCVQCSSGVGLLTAVGLIVLGLVVGLSQCSYFRHSSQFRLLLKTTDR
jgi:hypothetical protein